MDEIFVSLDVEASGPIPGPYSMYSFAAAAMNQEGEVVSTFSVNLEELPGASSHPETMEWWKTEPEAFAACRENPQPIQESIQNFTNWLDGLEKTPVLVGYPVAYDFLFMYWYLIMFVGRSPFGYNGIDVKAYSMAVQKKVGYEESGKESMPPEWIPESKHTHVAIDDAVEQGQLFLNIMNANLAK